MIKKINWKQAFPVLAVWIVTVLLLCTHYTNKFRIWPDLLTEGIVNTEDKTILSIPDGDSYRQLTFSSSLILPPGTYRFQWNLECDGINSLRLFSTNDARISPDTFDFGPGIGKDVYFTLKDNAEFLRFTIDFKDGTYLKIYNFRLYSPSYNDNRLTLILLASLFSVLWYLHCTGKKIHPSILLLAAAVIYSSVPSFRDNISDLYDTSFHISRLWNLASGLKAGQIPVRCAGYTYNGYGAVTSVFYPDILLYPFALLLLSGVSTNYVMQCIFVSLNILSCITMYQCALHILKDRWTAVISAILYTLAIYRITDVYIRCALGEAIAFAFLPILIRGIWSVWFGNREEWPWLTLGVCAVFFSHMLTVLMFLLGMLGLFIFYFPRLLREKRLIPLFKAGLLTLLICLFQLIPMLDYLQTGVGPMGMNMSVAGSAISPAQLFLWGEGDMPVDPWDTTLPGLPAEPGMILNIGAILAVYFLLARKEIEQKTRKNILRFSVIGLIGAYATTTLFPWDYLSTFTNNISDFFQFAWRFLIIPTVFFSLSAAFAYRQLTKEGEKSAVFVLIIATILVLPTLTAQTRFNDVYHFGEIAETVIAQEYNIPGTDVRKVRSRSVNVPEGITVSDYVKEGNRISCSADVQKDGQVRFPLFGFMGYRVTSNGQEIPYFCTGNNQLTVDLTPGHHDLRIQYVGKPLWHVFDVISLAAFIVLLVLMLKKRKSPAATELHAI